MYFLVIDDMRVSTIIGALTLEKLDATLNLSPNYVTLKICHGEVQFPVEHESSANKNRALPLDTDSKDFISESDTEDRDVSSTENG